MRFGSRYAAALAVDAIGAGLLRPFLVVYGLSVLHLSATATGLALSAGLLAGLIAVPLTGRWIDDAGGPFRSRVLPVVATLAVRVAGVGVLLAAHGVAAFSVASLLLGIGNQVWPQAHAALVATLAAPEPADAPLAAARSLRNAGLGAGALLAALAVAGGPDVLRLLAAGTAAGYGVAAVLVCTVVVPAAPLARTGRTREGRVPGMAVLVWANLPFALCFAVLEVALPVVLTEQLGASPAWSAILFAGNTVLVVALQVHLVVRLRHLSRRAVLAASGVVLAASYLGFWACGAAGAPLAALCAVAVAYTSGEILYAGSGTALVTEAAPRTASASGSCPPDSPTPRRRRCCWPCSTPAPECSGRCWPARPSWAPRRSTGGPLRCALRRRRSLSRRFAETGTAFTSDVPPQLGGTVGQDLRAPIDCDSHECGADGAPPNRWWCGR